MDIQNLYKLFLKYPIVSTDSRNIPDNSIFFSLKGANFNGNEYALESLDKGAQYAIIDEERYEVDERLILVGNVLETLQELATFHRVSSSSATVAAP